MSGRQTSHLLPLTPTQLHCPPRYRFFGLGQALLKSRFLLAFFVCVCKISSFFAVLFAQENSKKIPIQ